MIKEIIHDWNKFRFALSVIKEDSDKRYDYELGFWEEIYQTWKFE